MTNGMGDQDVGLPVAAPLQVVAAEPGADDRNSVFGSLVHGDADVVGLVAYSIYKQNKHDWLVAFAKSRGRDPNEDELHAYILGESTTRRLATYRHLAEATLDGRGPVPTSATDGSAPRAYAVTQRVAAGGSTQARPAAKIAIYALGAIVLLVAVYLAARLGMSARP